MSTQEQASPAQMLSIGTGLCIAGAWGMLIGFEVLPVPGGRGNLHGPLWLSTLLGIIACLAGVSCFIQGIGRASATGDLPANAPLWLRTGQYLIGVIMFASFALLGSWVAVGGDPRYFSGDIPFVGGPFNISFSRIMFGFGALICWLATIGYAVAGARKLLGRAQS
jgi:hypothetical protein